MSNEELVDRIQHGINVSEYMKQLYVQNKGFIYNVIKKYRYACQSDYGSIPIMEIDELMHEAYFGLVKAAETYNPDQGALFLTYAAYWISQSVKRFLENSGQVIRVPVHRQQGIYKYNQATAYCLRNYNRMPYLQEYAWYVGISVKGIERLEKFMFQSVVRSLDEAVPGGEDDSLSFLDTVPADVDIENDIVEKVFQEQVKAEIWDIVAQVLKDDKKIQVFKWRFGDGLTLEEIGKRNKINKTAVDQLIKIGIRRMRSNSRTKQLGIDLGLWEVDKPMHIDRVRLWAEAGRISALDKKELAYAKRMGWLKEELRNVSES